VATAEPATVSASDYELLRDEVGLLDRSERGALRLTGTEAAEFLQGQVSNDVLALSPGEGCYATLLDHKGKIRADLRVLRGPDWLLLDTEPAGLAPLAHTASTYSLGRDVTAVDETAERAVLSLIGPAARARLEVAPAPSEHSFVAGEHGLYVTTDVGVDVLCPLADVEAAKLALGVAEIGPAAAECIRIESGRPRLGFELDSSTIPQEAGLNERAVSFTKGCYVGQETVARLHYKGRPNRHLRGLRLSAPAPAGAEAALGERAVGRLGSACVSPRLGPIGLAVLRREADPGARVRVGAEGVEAEVVELPFPGAERP
jgi:folate-binding protein YgfZ